MGKIMTKNSSVISKTSTNIKEAVDDETDISLQLASVVQQCARALANNNINKKEGSGGM